MEINKTIDHTLLKPCTVVELEKLCEEAVTYNFMSVCVLPDNVEYAARLLKNQQPKVCTVIGFPLGENTTLSKVYEANDAIEKGATEIDMVINLSWAKRQEWSKVEEEIRQIVKVANDRALVKVIIETCLLTQEDIVKACHCVVNAKADYVKTSTGFSTAGATVENVKLMADTVKGSGVKVKASGGVRNFVQTQEMINAGASRIGTSNGIAIVTGTTATNKY